MSRLTFEQGLTKAHEMGHSLQNDPPSISSTTRRHTCTKCGCAVLCNTDFAYGSALTEVCKGVLE